MKYVLCVKLSGKSVSFDVGGKSRESRLVLYFSFFFSFFFYFEPGG